MAHATQPKPRKWFEGWHEPNAFHRAAHNGVIAFYEADKDVPHYLSEAYIAGVFARIWRDDRVQCEVRLVPKEEKFPDAQLRADNACLDLEVTMALKKSKKMFEEWREGRARAKQGEFAPAEAYEQRRASAREAIPRAVGKKAAKHYAEPPTLLVYADDGRALSAEEMARLTEPWKNCFAAIYLLCGMDVVMAWPTLRVLRGTGPF